MYGEFQSLCVSGCVSVGVSACSCESVRLCMVSSVYV